MPDERGGGRTDHDAAGAAADHGYSEWISEVRRLYVEPKGATEMYGHPAADEVSEAEHDGPARGWGLPHLGRGRRHEKVTPPAPAEVPDRPSLADLIAAPAPRALPSPPPEPEPQVEPAAIQPVPEPEPQVEPVAIQPEPLVRRADRHRTGGRGTEAQEGPVDPTPPAQEEPVHVRSWFDEGDPEAEPVDAEATPVFRPWTLPEDTAPTRGLDALPRRSDRHQGGDSGSRTDTPDTDPAPPDDHAAPSPPAPRTRAEARAAARRQASAWGSRRRRALVAALVLLVVVATTWWVMRPTQPVSPDTTTAQHSALGLVVDRSATTPLTHS